MRKLGSPKKRAKRTRPSVVLIGAAALAAGIAGAPSRVGAAPIAAASPVPAQPPERRRLTIAAQPLLAALARFSVLTGVRVLYDPQELSGLTAPAIDGRYTPEEALRALLAGSAVTYRFVDPQTVRLAPTLATIGRVATSYGQDSALSKFTAPLLQTPQSVVVVPHETLAQQNAATFSDVMRNVSGISLTAGEGGAQGDALTIRGFSGSGNLYLDGLRDFGEYYRDPFDLERVEVAEGPSSTIVGPGSAGGFVNQITKKPQLDPFAETIVTGETNDGERATFDVNEPLAAHTAFRLDGMQTAAGVAGRDVTDVRRWGAAPSIEFGLGTSTRVLLAYEHLTEHDIPDYGIPYLWGSPAPVPRTSYYGFSDDEFFETSDIATLTLEHDLGDSLSLRNVTREAAYNRTFRAATAAFATPPAFGTPLQNIAVTRSEHAENGHDRYFDNQTDLLGEASTGAVRHSYDVGVEIGAANAHDVRPSYAGLPGTSLLAPNEDQPITFTAVTTGSDAHVAASDVAFYGIDSIRFSKRWVLNAGVRWDNFEANDAEAVTQVNAGQGATALTGHAGLVYDVAPNGTVYLSYATAFDPAVDTFVLTQAASLVPPEFDRSTELGSKWELGHARFSLRGALFHESATNVAIAEDSYTSTAAFVANEEIDGAEVRADGHVTPRWDVSAGYTLLNGTLGATNEAGAAGNQLVNVPRNSATLWTTYAVPHAWSVGFGATGLTERYARPAPSASTQGLIPVVPGYWRLDAMVSAPVTPSLALQLNLYNLTDKQYYDAVYTDHVVPGAAFSASLSVVKRFK